jgi:hypothetical protein
LASRPDRKKMVPLSRSFGSKTWIWSYGMKQ